jgi:lipid A 4'-phosphatase
MYARGGRSTLILWGLPVATGVVAGTVFLAVPEIDLDVARVFHAPETGFVGRRLFWVEALRQAFVALYFGTVALAIAGLALTWRARPAWLRLSSRQWLFLAACLATGPGLVANVVFKDRWGRARPSQVAEFGGAKAFTPPLAIAGQCPRNCSFVSGEASSTYATFYAGAVLVPQWSLALVVVGTLGGLLTGLIRMSQGGHFLSDVIFAGVFMALTVLAMRRLLLQRGGPHER